jgi:hypothetical protein
MQKFEYSETVDSCQSFGGEGRNRAGGLRRRSLQNVSLWRALAVMMTFAWGCADLGSGDDGEERPEDGAGEAEIDERSAAILGAAQGSVAPNVPRSGAVEIISPTGGCSGVLVGNAMVLTAAHCYGVAGAVSYYFDGKIQLAITGTTWHCLTGSPMDASGKCQEDRRISFERYDAAASPSAARDIMALFPGDFGTAWPGYISGWAAPGIWAGAIGINGVYDGGFYLYGRGYGTSAGNDNGIMRYAGYTNNSVALGASSYSITAPADPRGCRGDSGGPAEDATFGGTINGYVQGLFVSGMLSGECVKPGGTMNFTKMSANKMAWINQKRDGNGYGSGGCFTVNGPNAWQCN